MRGTSFWRWTHKLIEIRFFRKESNIYLGFDQFRILRTEEDENIGNRDFLTLNPCNLTAKLPGKEIATSIKTNYNSKKNTTVGDTRI